VQQAGCLRAVRDAVASLIVAGFVVAGFVVAGFVVAVVEAAEKAGRSETLRAVAAEDFRSAIVCSPPRFTRTM
jgi:hypothetical protein